MLYCWRRQEKRPIHQDHFFLRTRWAGPGHPLLPESKEAKLVLLAFVHKEWFRKFLRPFLAHFTLAPLQLKNRVTKLVPVYSSLSCGNYCITHILMYFRSKLLVQHLCYYEILDTAKARTYSYGILLEIFTEFESDLQIASHCESDFSKSPYFLLWCFPPPSFLWEDLVIGLVEPQEALSIPTIAQMLGKVLCYKMSTSFVNDCCSALSFFVMSAFYICCFALICLLYSVVCGFGWLVVFFPQTVSFQF